MLDEYKRYVSEYINRIKEKDSGTIQFDWFISSDKKEAEIIEVYASCYSEDWHLGQLDRLEIQIWSQNSLIENRKVFPVQIELSRQKFILRWSKTALQVSLIYLDTNEDKAWCA